MLFFGLNLKIIIKIHIFNLYNIYNMILNKKQYYKT